MDRTRPVVDRGRPGGRGDQRRPGGRRDTRRPSTVAATALARAQRETSPPFWFADRLLAVLSGLRPVHWMLGHAGGEAYEQLIRLAPEAPLRTGTRVRPAVRDCGEYHPGPGVIEAFARISVGNRISAMAFRLERGADQRWRCVAVEVGGAHTTAGDGRR
ncbi:Rv3235 family protein [Streptomyces sp. NPDC057638]|uniref:Rv3235 family protein n=1 Tax=Streptomyces sp. NPDC057638 TaxID=3346190 RepID=UPI0036B3B7D9